MAVEVGVLDDYGFVWDAYAYGSRLGRLGGKLRV